MWKDGRAGTKREGTESAVAYNYSNHGSLHLPKGKCGEPWSSASVNGHDI